MGKHLQRELEKIKQSLLSLGAVVEERVHQASSAIMTRNAFDIDRVIKYDYEIDETEVEIEEECLKILALHQPVAADLRFLTATIKINNDLERIADEAVNIARRVEILAKNDNCEFSFDYLAMSEKIETMLKMSLDSLINLDEDRAFKVCLMDDEVDDMNRDAYGKIKASIQMSPGCVGPLLNYFLISRHLERIGDHATNIAEEVIYMIEGEIVRHGKF